MQQEKKNLFTLIFCDAHVIDVDFSEWDKCIRLCVIGLDVEYPIPTRLPIFVVEFVRVRQFNCTFHHLGIKLVDQNRHFQWNIHDSKVKSISNDLHIELIGSGASPVINIICESYEIVPLSHSLLDSSFPGWDRPFSPLVRPSIERMSRVFNLIRKKQSVMGKKNFKGKNHPDEL